MINCFLKDEALILYPSITVCKIYSFEHPKIFSSVNNMSNDEDISEPAISAIKNHLPTLDEYLFYFTQPSVMNLTFPCTTTLGGSTPGRPCTFPVTWIYENRSSYLMNKTKLTPIVNV